MSIKLNDEHLRLMFVNMLKDVPTTIRYICPQGYIKEEVYSADDIRSYFKGEPGMCVPGEETEHREAMGLHSCEALVIEDYQPQTEIENGSKEVTCKKEKGYSIGKTGRRVISSAQ